MLIPSRRWAVLVPAIAVAAAGALLGGCGEDDEEAETETLRLVADEPRIEVVDLGKPDKSPGDVYVIESELLDEGEEESVGRLFATQTSLKLTRDVEVVQAFATFELGGGDQIVFGGISEYPREGLGNVVGEEYVRPILGGTGAYAGATGTVTTVQREDGRFEQELQIKT
jgi:hypothetical protein